MRVSIGTSSQWIGSRKPRDDPVDHLRGVGLGAPRQAEDEAQLVDVVDRRARAEDVAEPLGAGADEGLRAGVAEYPQDLAEGPGVAEGHEHQRRLRRAPEHGVGAVLAAVGKQRDRIEARRRRPPVLRHPRPQCCQAHAPPLRSMIPGAAARRPLPPGEVWHERHNVG